MFDYELYKKVVEIRQHLKEKYQFEEFEMFLSTYEGQSIEYKFKHFDIVDKKQMVENILKDSISLLKERGYDYKHDIIYPYPLMVSSQPIGLPVPNESTYDYYSLIKESKNE